MPGNYRGHKVITPNDPVIFDKQVCTGGSNYVRLFVIGYTHAELRPVIPHRDAPSADAQVKSPFEYYPDTGK
jgi:hypothetical protein